MILTYHNFSIKMMVQNSGLVLYVYPGHQGIIEGLYRIWWGVNTLGDSGVNTLGDTTAFVNQAGQLSIYII